MTQRDQTGTAPAANAPHWTSRWRATYRRGEWLLLSGPTSLMVMQPAAPQWSDLINAVWEDLLGAASLSDLAARLAEFRLDGMPDFAALFWERDQMRSLVRGRVRLVDPDTGRSVATGEGVQTWSEVGLGDLQQVEVHAGDQSEDEQLELPLVIGAVNASRVLLDCSDEMQIRSPQGTFVGDAGALDRLDAPAEPPSTSSPADQDPSGAAVGGAAAGGTAVGGAVAGGAVAGGAVAGGTAGASAAPGGSAVPGSAGPSSAAPGSAPDDRWSGQRSADVGRPAHAADGDVTGGEATDSDGADSDAAEPAETLVDQPPVRPDADRSDAGRPDPDRSGAQSPGPSGAGRSDTSGPQHASPGSAATGAALAAGAAGATAAGAAGAGAAGAGAAGAGAASSGAAGGAAGAGSAGAVPSGPDPAGPGAANDSASGASAPSQFGPSPSDPSPSGPPSASGPTSRPDPSGQDDDGHTMVAEGLPGLAASPGRAGEPPQRPVLGVLHPSTGGTTEIDRPVVIGRSPVASRVRSDQLPRLMTVPSPSHDISRTHVQIAPENGRLVVTDLNSTNGTILVMPDGRRTDLQPGAGVPVEFGSVIDLGDGVTIAVERS